MFARSPRSVTSSSGSAATRISIFFAVSGLAIFGSVSHGSVSHGLGARKPLHETSVIYGRDDRVDVFEINDEWVRQLARATVALVEDEQIDLRSVGSRQPSDAAEEALAILRGQPLRQAYRLCPGERFESERALAFCTGVLIDEDTVLTAGHCVESREHCERTRFVFDYKKGTAQDPLDAIASRLIHKCREVVVSRTEGDADFAVIRLDRPVLDRRPLSLDDARVPEAGDAVFVIGHPLGLPMKGADGAHVRTVGRDFFNADLDAFSGNSGSPVFSSRTRSLAGILVSGEDDFERRGICNATKRCDQGGCRGEDVMSATRIRDALRALSDQP